MAEVVCADNLLVAKGHWFFFVQSQQRVYGQELAPLCDDKLALTINGYLRVQPRKGAQPQVSGN